MPTTDELAEEILAVRNMVPTVEELRFSLVIPGWAASPGANLTTTISSSTRFTLAAFDSPVRIIGVSCSFDYWNQSASDTSYWSAYLEKGTDAAGFPDIAMRSTRVTGSDANGAIQRRTPWTFEAATWIDPNIAAGELLAITWNPVGSPSALQMPATYTVRYRPI